jgi:Rap1a immunity proteins
MASQWPRSNQYHTSIIGWITGASMAAVLLLAAFISGTHAQVQWDGDRLLAACQQGHGPASDCAVFIRGVVDRYHELIATHCAPRHVPFSENVARVIADLEVNPSARSLSAHQLILESIGMIAGCRLVQARHFVDEVRLRGTL